MIKSARKQRLQRFLGGLYEERIAQKAREQAVQLARYHEHERDRELVAFLALTLEGLRPPLQCRKVLDLLLERLGQQPGLKLVRSTPEMLREITADLEIGFLKKEALAAFLVALKSLLKRERSLRLAFQKESGKEGKRDLLVTLDRFMISIIRGIPREERALKGVAHLLPRPAKGSAVARLHRFLRTMSRPDNGIDLGLWPELKPERLFLPLDGPVLERCRWLKLTERSVANRGAVTELTQLLRLLDEQDPILFSHAFEYMIEQDWDVETMRQRFRHA